MASLADVLHAIVGKIDLRQEESTQLHDLIDTALSDVAEDIEAVAK